MARGRVAVAISGGVDSSTAALLLKEDGYEVIGMHMSLWRDEKSEPDREQHQHKLKRAVNKAEEACQKLGIPFYVIELKNEFKGRVVDYFCSGYAQGRTPNPCIVCNKYIKFGLLLEEALSLGASYLATGHYARIKHFDNKYHLLKGADSSKDQSYVLYTLEQEKLSHIVFPLGDYLKTEVRKIAQQSGLPTAEEPGSQDICFIDGKYSDFLSYNIITAIGEIVNKQGVVLGKHNGVAFYTIGQRHGLGFSTGQRFFVTSIEPAQNRIVVGTEEELYSQELTAGEVSWVSGKAPFGPMDIAVKIRYKSPEVDAVIYPELNSAKIKFRQPQRAVTPGQAVVFYLNNEVIGGGIIEKQE
jgi:tRNA-specific 2-thiouridylase